MADLNQRWHRRFLDAATRLTKEGPSSLTLPDAVVARLPEYQEMARERRRLTLLLKVTTRHRKRYEAKLKKKREEEAETRQKQDTIDRKLKHLQTELAGLAQWSQD